MLQQAKLKTQLVVCDILREEDGLAMSSRNTRLKPEDRAVAQLIHKTMKEAAERVGVYSPTEIQRFAAAQLRAEPRFKLEYFDIVDGRTLLPISLFEDTDFAVALTAVWAGDVRLIDKMILKQATMQEENEDLG